jgi:hypothetical protein
MLEHRTDHTPVEILAVATEAAVVVLIGLLVHDVVEEVVPVEEAEEDLTTLIAVVI